MKVLVAEDDTFLSDAFNAKLLSLGHEVQIAQNGEEVFVKLAKFLPDIIILDIIMPKKNGMMVLKELKNSSKFSQIPVLIASNVDEESNRRKGLDLGAADYFVKSDISIKELIARCEKIVKSNHA